MDMKEEDRAALLEFVQSGGLQDVVGTTRSYWGSRANQAGREVIGQYATAIGVDPKTLPPRAIARMASNIRFFIEEDRTGERQQRFEMGDPSFIDECVQDMLGLYVEPVRRATATAGARNLEQNRRLPAQGGPAGAPGPQAGQPQTRQQKREAARQFVLSNR